MSSGTLLVGGQQCSSQWVFVLCINSHLRSDFFEKYKLILSENYKALTGESTQTSRAMLFFNEESTRSNFYYYLKVSSSILEINEFLWLWSICLSPHCSQEMFLLLWYWLDLIETCTQWSSNGSSSNLLKVSVIFVSSIGQILVTLGVLDMLVSLCFHLFVQQRQLVTTNPIIITCELSCISYVLHHWSSGYSRDNW